ncbi:MAG: tryptophan-rich sensory protein [Anderseniella sp.]
MAFFAARSTLLGLIAITALWLTIALAISVFRPIDRFAARLLAHYLLWVSFAAALNFAFWYLN